MSESDTRALALTIETLYVSADTPLISFLDSIKWGDLDDTALSLGVTVADLKAVQDYLNTPRIVAHYADGSGTYLIIRHRDELTTLINGREAIANTIERAPQMDGADLTEYALTANFASCCESLISEDVDPDGIVWIDGAAYAMTGRA